MLELIAYINGGKEFESELGSDMLKVLKSAKGFIVETAKGAMVDSARGVIIDSMKGFLIDPVKGFIMDSAKGFMVSSSTAAPSSVEETQLWKSYQEYQATRPASITTFHISNTALELNISGGKRFDVELGNEDMLQILRMAKGFILNSFSLSQAKEFKDITLSVENIDGVADTHSDKHGNPEIHLSAQYVDRVAPGDRAALFYEIAGVLIHESTHVWQNNNGTYGEDRCFTGVIEGIADFIRLRSGYPAKHWVRKVGGTWHSGYATTAYFFDWIDKTQSPGFVNQLNFMMASAWNVRFFQEITGKSVDHLWQTYQESL